MKTKEKRGAVSASGPLSDVLKSLPSGATVIAAGGSRTPELITFCLVYSFNGSTVHLSITQEGGQS